MLLEEWTSLKAKRNGHKQFGSSLANCSFILNRSVCNDLTLKGLSVRPIYTICTSSHQVLKSCNVYCGFETLSCVKEKIKIVICDTDGRYTTHVFASKGTHVMYWNLIF